MDRTGLGVHGAGQGPRGVGQGQNGVTQGAAGAMLGGDRNAVRPIPASGASGACWGRWRRTAAWTRHRNAGGPCSPSTGPDAGALADR